MYGLSRRGGSKDLKLFRFEGGLTETERAEGLDGEKGRPRWLETAATPPPHLHTPRTKVGSFEQALNPMNLGLPKQHSWAREPEPQNAYQLDPSIPRPTAFSIRSRMEVVLARKSTPP